MATLVPPSNVEAAYEDMFKEITRKLYGEETGNGLHTLGTPVAQVATTGPTAPEGERSFTNLIDRSSAPTIEYEHNAGGPNAAAVATAAAAQQQQQQNANVVIQQQPEGSVVVATTSGGGGNFKSEDHLSTAFGLAALMQNGFATTGGTILSTQQAINKAVSNASQQQGGGNEQRWNTDSATAAGGDPQQQPQIVQWTTTGGKLQSYTAAAAAVQQQQQQQQQQLVTPKSKSKNRIDHSAPVNATGEVIYTSPSISGNAGQPAAATTSGGGGGGGGGRSKKKSQNHQVQMNADGTPIIKRYPCTHCPYSTDRRDLYTRHENIHKEEKPFQCFACLKQFNRADHVKKHFLRMHRELQYDINKTRRHASSGNHHSGGRGNVTISTVHSNGTSSGTSASGSPEQKPNIFQASNVQLDHAFLDGQRQPHQSSLNIVETIEAVASAAEAPLQHMKQEKNDDGSAGGVAGNGSLKPKREKRFTCCYCPWQGADKWGLKRHLNTHTKPFVCLLCDYKAARSERLATHVLKVHNKRACGKCSFLADSLEEYNTHITEVHPHDNRPARNNSNSTTSSTTANLNVLRTIGNTLVTNNQLNTFQNASTFGHTTTTTNAVGNAGGSVTIYTTTTTNDNGSGNLTGGPLQEIIVNPSSMVGWRLSANGSLIPPHDLLTGTLPNAATQKRGSERLFQYLEAEGSDPEDYARLLKMDAISRNTASVAQDFHKAGGVHELKLPANHQLLFNNKLPSQWTTKEAAALLHSLSTTSFAYHHQQQQQQQQQLQQRSRYYPQLNGAAMRQRQHSTGEDDENTPSSASSTTSNDDGGISGGLVSTLKMQRKFDRSLTTTTTTAAAAAAAAMGGVNSDQRKAMSAFLSKNFDLQERKPIISELVANGYNSSNNNKRKAAYQQQQQQQQPYDFIKIKEEIVDNDEDQENQMQLIKSPPAYNHHSNNTNANNYKNNNYNNYNTTSNKAKNMTNNNRHQPQQQQHQQQQQHANNTSPNGGHREQHRLDLIRDNKENTNNAAATFLTTMEYQNLNKIGTQFQNYVKDIINKYYAETPLMFPAMPTATTTGQQQQQQQSQPLHGTPAKRKRMLSETEQYIEYLKNKEDITLTITPKSHGGSGGLTASQKQQSLLRRQQQQQELSPLPRRRESPKKQPPVAPQLVLTAPSGNGCSSPSSRKSLSQLATLLPLLADAASQQQYLTAPLDFSKKSSAATTTTMITSPAITEMPSTVESAAPRRNDNASITIVDERASIKTPSPPPHQQLTRSGTPTPSADDAGHDKRSSRKQAQPKKMRFPPEMVVALLRDKYLNRMVDRKLSCSSCANGQHHTSMLVFSYHTKGSLALHRYWKHGERQQPQHSCAHCDAVFGQAYRLQLHCRRVHPEQACIVTSAMHAVRARLHMQLKAKQRALLAARKRRLASKTPLVITLPAPSVGDGATNRGGV